MIKIERVKKSSIADKLGVKAGNHLISIDNKEINDALDLKFFEAGTFLNIEISDGKRTRFYNIEKEEAETLGIEPSEFKMKLCKNNCIFCFINQNPNDVRESLLAKDDDYRMSFLYGNYLSLTNFTNKDFERVSKLKLSPLYISVHTTNPEKRIEIMRNKKAGKIKEDLNKLSEAGIKLHTQIVLLPGVNDGEFLHETIEDLLSISAVESIGVVPVGLTALRDGLPYIEPPTPKWMNEIIRLTEPYQAETKRKRGSTIIYLADEFYIKTKNAIPSSKHYDDFPQLENGIGMARKFLDGIKSLKVPDFEGKVLLVTGTLAYDIINKLADKFRKAGINTEVIAVRNRYFGNSVEVAALLGGWDLMGLLSVRDFDVVILPPDIVNRDELFIDGCSLKNLKKALRKRIIVSPYNVLELGNIK
jgi:putative radical SAM enzyme (TIGR03279 family)